MKRLTFLSLGWHVLRDFRLDVLRQCVLGTRALMYCNFFWFVNTNFHKSGPAIDQNMKRPFVETTLGKLAQFMKLTMNICVRKNVVLRFWPMHM